MTIPARKTMARNALILLGAFLLGLIPPLVSNIGLRSDLREATQAIQVADLKELAALAHLEVSRNNFGAASQHASELFDRMSALSASTDKHDPALDQAMQKRAAVMELLANADPAARVQVQEVVDLVVKQSGTGLTGARARAR
jgi:Asp-tRNA(Asn)/Glu-tRNA(Gln) amidotransferase C subunit